MVFKDIKNSINEELYNVKINVINSTCTVSFAYPNTCRKVCAFAVPFDDTFDEKRAEANEYVMYTVKHPDTSFNANKISDFAIFAVDVNDNLIRQNPIVYCCPIDVIYSYTTETKRALFKKPESHTFLSIVSNIDLCGRKILYRLSDNDAVFCLPFDLHSGKQVRLEVQQKFKLYTTEDNINLRVTQN